MRQPDERLRALNSEPANARARAKRSTARRSAPRVPTRCTSSARTWTGIGWGEAANDDGSGTALVMELARVFSMPDVQTERSIRFVLWNNEETGLNGARAYVAQRKALQGKEDPPGRAAIPEPKWLGMIQHDMMLFDHGMPRADGTISPEQRPEADVNIEFQINSKMAAESQKLAWFLHAANEKYATDYPAQVGPHMTNTDSTPFMDVVASISLRENERGAQIGSGWDPHWHQPTDLFTHVLGQGLPARAQRRADDAGGGGAAHRREAEKLALCLWTVASESEPQADLPGPGMPPGRSVVSVRKSVNRRSAPGCPKTCTVGLLKLARSVRLKTSPNASSVLPPGMLMR